MKVFKANEACTICAKRHARASHELLPVRMRCERNKRTRRLAHNDGERAVNSAFLSLFRLR